MFLSLREYLLAIPSISENFAKSLCLETVRSLTRRSDKIGSGSFPGSNL